MNANYQFFSGELIKFQIQSNAVFDAVIIILSTVKNFLNFFDNTFIFANAELNGNVIFLYILHFE